MDAFRGSASVNLSDVTNGSMTADIDTEEHQQSDRQLVNTLLDVSEEYLVKDQDTDEFRNHTGWEEAVQGWGRGPPLICLFQIQRRGKRPKTWDADSHCLLCVDTKIVEPHVTETARHSPEFCNGPSEKNSKKTISPKVDLVKARPSSTYPTTISLHRNTVELLPKQTVLAKKLTGIGGLLINRTASTCVSLPHHQENQCQTLKGRFAGNVTLINCFAVLPPLKTSLDGNACCPNHLESGKVSFGAEQQDMVEILQRGASAAASAGGNGVNGSGEMRTEAHLDFSSAQDGLHSSDASKYWTCQKSQHLLTAFSVPITKRSDQPFSAMDDAMPRVTYRLGRYPRQEDLARSPGRNNSGKLYFGYKTKNIRRAEPKLPMLFGTRVAIPASTHRL